MLKLKNTKGFTIIELLIVIAIITILSGLVLNNFRDAQAKARDTERRQDIYNVHTKLEEFYNENGSYPGATGPTATALDGLDAEALVDPDGTSMAVSTTDSATKPATAYTADKPTGAQYTYAGYECETDDSSCDKYVIYGWLEVGDDPYEPYEKNSLN